MAEHSYSLAISTLLLTPPTLNRNKAVSMALIHDIQETIIGDFTPSDNILPETKKQLEMQAATRISQQLDCPEMLKLFMEYEQSSSPESCIVKDLDRLDAVLLASYYEKHHRTNQSLLPEFLAYAQKQYIGNYNCNTVATIYNELKKEI
ncbi:MAG: HD domain-containing protein [Rhodospirillales bacterium]|nr:HD domain-containing protein [Rhodospirillales bacterium]